jgi:hypothetical protein
MIISPGPPPRGTQPPVRRADRAGDAVRTLVRAQLRAALVTCALVLAVIVGLPLLPMLTPELGWVRPYGIPLPWMGLAFAAQPLWVALAVWHLHRCERVERAFLDAGSAADQAPGHGGAAPGEETS